MARCAWSSPPRAQRLPSPLKCPLARRVTRWQGLPSGSWRCCRAQEARVADKRRGRPDGFTLVEVLVALAIIAIALLAALRAAGQSTANASELRARLLGSWVAENLLAGHRA